MPLGVPVVPEENMMTNGVLKGTCSNSNIAPAPLSRKLSNEILEHVSRKT